MSSMIRDYQQVQILCGSGDDDMTRMHTLASESEQQRLQRLLQTMRVINDSQRSGDSIHRSLVIELLSMHLFAPFDQIELAAGREGQDEAKAAYRNAQSWSQRCQARQAVSSAGQAVRYLREIPPREFTEFDAIVAYQVSLCQWTYGAITFTDAKTSTGNSPSSVSAQISLDTDEMVKVQEWITLNRGIPAICKSALSHELSQGDRMMLSSTKEVMISLRDLLPYGALRDKTESLTSSLYDLMSALSTARSGPSVF
jgi:hypothetical protein